MKHWLVVLGWQWSRWPRRATTTVTRPAHDYPLPHLRPVSGIGHGHRYSHGHRHAGAIWYPHGHGHSFAAPSPTPMAVARSSWQRQRPVSLALRPDGRLFYNELRTGRVRIVEDGQLLDEPLPPSTS